MSRVVTASEVDRLHQQVAELQSQVTSLNQTVYSQQQQCNELQQRAAALEQAPNLTPASAPQAEVELFEDLEVVDSQETRNVATQDKPEYDVLASESPAAL